MVPLYDAEQFEGLIQRERARADRAAARPPRDLSARRTATTKGPGGKQLDPVWGATTDNREFSLVIFRPQTRADRSGLVDLLQSSVRTTDAVGIIDNRRLGVLLPDTAAENAAFFVKKVLAGAEAASVQLSHVVHTYPNNWPEDGSPDWQEPRRIESTTPPAIAPAIERHDRPTRRPSDGAIKGFVGWLQHAAFRRSSRDPIRA
ncbi:MAG: hypothetical protein JO353_11750 [Phycisphaerae bacterium]|nr:hypothetical protein [Phycisphaerae bacterium]